MIGALSELFFFTAECSERRFSSFVSSQLPLVVAKSEVEINDAFLLGNDSEKDLLVCALLGSSGLIDDPALFWEHNVARKLSIALADGFDRWALSGIAEGIKQNFLVGVLEPADFKESVSEELQALDEFPLEYAVASLPQSFSELLEAADLDDKERASISFLFKDKIAQAGQAEALSFAEGCIAQFADAGEDRSINYDKRIYGLMQAAEVEKIISDSRLRPNSINRFFYKNIHANIACMKKAKTGELLFILKKFPIEDKAIESCSICSFDDRTLYENICPCNTSMPLCEECIRELTLEKIIGDLRIEFSGTRSGPAHIVFSLQLPRCPYCKRIYYEEKDYVLFEQSLPLLKRKALVVEALTSQLEKFTTEGSLENIVTRLVATNNSYQGIELRTFGGALLSPQEIALQLFKKDGAMPDALAEPFTNAAIWRR